MHILKVAAKGILFSAGLCFALGAAHAQTVLKMGFGLPVTAHYGVGASYMQQEIEKRTGGVTSSNCSPTSHSAVNAR